MSDTWTQDTFTIWQPSAVTLVKGDDPTDRRIGGYASTEALDRQGEVVLQHGLDFSEFVQHGYYNDNHRQETAAVVGVPEMARYDHGRGWWTEGHLLKGTRKADEIWELAKALDATDRRLGFSIEGKVQRRDSNKIVKALVRHVAITNSPVNTECTWGVLAKSFCSNPGARECHGTCCEAGTAKALSVGHVKGQSGLVLVPESLEGGKDPRSLGRRKKVKKGYTYECGDCQKGFASERGLDGHRAVAHQTTNTSIRRIAKALTREEAVARLRTLRPNLSETTAARVVDYVLASNAQ